jgi:proteasome subunit B (beta)-like protein
MCGKGFFRDDSLDSRLLSPYNSARRWRKKYSPVIGRREVTVCVAAIAHAGSPLNPCIVLASDKEIGLGDDLRAEIAGKQGFLTIHWTMMIAGEDITPAIDVRRYASAALFDLQRNKQPLTLDAVIAVLRDSVLRRRTEIVESMYLNSIGWTLEQFKAHGKDSIPEHIYGRILDQMRNADIPYMVLLIAGFDNVGFPHLFTIDWDGIARVHDDLGFCAIGSGERSALTTLFYRKVNSDMDVSDALYFVFEAKAAGESAPGV